MPALALMLLVAPEFARLAVLPVLAVLLVARCLAPPAAPCALPYWRAVSAAVLLVVPLVVLTASLGLVGWGFMSRYEHETAVSFFWARDIVLQVSWLPFDLGVLYFFNPAVVLVLLPSTRLPPRGVLIGLFVALVALVETARVLCLVALVAPRLRAPAQTMAGALAGLLLCTLSVPLAALSRRAGQPHRANPWLAISLALAFYTLAAVLGIPSIAGSVQTRYALLVGAACMQACAVAALLVVFFSPATPHPPAAPAPIRLSGYSTPERQRRPHRRSAASTQTFMSLRDPFASPPPTILREKKHALGLSPLSAPPKARVRQGSVDSLGLDAAFLEKLVELSFSEGEPSEDGTGSVYWHGHEFGVLSSKGSSQSPASTLAVRERVDSAATRRTATPTPMPRAYRAGGGVSSPPSTPPSLVISSPASSSRDWTRGLEPESAESSDADSSPSPQL